MSNPPLRTFSYGGADVDRFWRKVARGADDECWPWLGKPNEKGYGRFGVRRKVVMAHQFAYVLANGALAEEHCALHRCDNPICCNPAHLFAGTIADNNRDMWAKGRGKITHQRSRTTFSPEFFRDNGHPRAKLTPGDVAELRLLRSDGWKLRDLAARYGISMTQVSKTARGLTYREVA